MSEFSSVQTKFRVITFGRKIKVTFLNKGIKVQRVAKTIKVYTTRLAMVERGEKRLQTIADAATITPDTAYDGGKVAEVSQTVTVENPVGNYADMHQYILRIHSTVQRVLHFGTKYRQTDENELPSATQAGKTLVLGFQYNLQSDTWDLLASVLA